MSRSIFQELKTTTPAGLGAASWPIQIAVLGLWGFTVWGFGEMWVFKDTRLDLANQRTEWLRVERALDAAQEETQDETQAPPANPTLSRSGSRQENSRQEHIKALRRAYERLGPLPADGVWLARAEALAKELGLDGVIQTQAWASDDDPSHQRPWLDSDTSNPHLEAITSASFLVKLEGDLVALLAWLDGVMQGHGHGRVWLHQLDMARAEEASRAVGAASVQMQVVLSVVGLSAAHQPVASEPIKPFDLERQLLWRERLHERLHVRRGEHPWGRGHRSPDWWRALPLSRLDLVGTGHMDGVSWAWVLDPRGDLHQLFVDTAVARPPQRVVAIESWGVSLLDLATETPLAWEIGQR